MKKIDDAILADRVAAWLFAKGCGAVSVVFRDGQYHVYYTLKLDIVPQPAVRVHNGSIIFPSGSQEEVVLAFLAGE